MIARDTTHAGQLVQWIKSDEFFEVRYKDKVIQVDSSRSRVEEEEMIERLRKVEHTDEPTEAVIHVNMLKEGCSRQTRRGSNVVQTSQRPRGHLRR